MLATAIAGTSTLLGPTAGAAEASMSTTVTLPLRATDWVDSSTVPRFDVSLGELRSVDLRVDAHLEGTVAVENLSGAPATLSTTLAAVVTVARPAPGGTAITAQPSRARTDGLAPFDGVTDHTGASGSTSALADDHTSTVSLTAPADLALFSGPGTITLPTTGTDVSTGATGPDVDIVLSTEVGASVTVTYTYVTDTRPPDAPVIESSPPALTADPQASVTFTAEAGAAIECRLDAETATGTWDPCATPWQADLSGEPDGAYTFLVRATDVAGNVGDPATVAFTLDRQAPAPPVFTSTPAARGRLVNATWAFTIETGAVARCSLDGTAPAPCSSPFVADLTSAADGAHVLSVFAVDSAGNTGPTTAHTYILDRQAPGPPSITGGPPSPASDPTPTWSFDLAAEATSASCSVDGAPFTSCASPFTANLAAAADGDHTVAIRNSDLAGNQSTEATRTYRLDREAPGAPTIDSPASPSRVVDPTWTIGTEPGASTACRLDAGAWAPCTNAFTTTFGPGSDGVHMLTVRATDAAGNTGPETTSTYTLDTTPPAAPMITTTPADPSNSPTPTWTFAIETGSAAACSIDGGAWSPCASPHVADLTSASDGLHTLSVRATDPQGNIGPEATSQFTLDRSAPEAPTITNAPASPGAVATVTWTFMTPVGTTTTCRIDAGPAQPCDGSVTSTFTTDGSHHLAITAHDAAGNASAVATAAYVLDRVAPQPPTIDSAPVTPDRQTTPQWTFTLEDPSIGECSLDGAQWVPCTTSYSADLSTAGDGLHTFAVRSIDAAGNIGEAATGAFELDRTPPNAPAIVDGPEADSRDDSPTWIFTVVSGDATECRIDDGEWVPCTDSLTADLLGAPDGIHSIEVRAIDGVGNIGPTTVAAYSLDRVQPAVAELTSTPLSPGNDATPEWAFTYEPGTTARCSLDGGEATVCDGTFAATLLGDGTHELTVQVTDAAGNASHPLVSTYELDTAPPSPPTIGEPRTPDRRVRPVWTITLEPGAVAECSFDGGPPEACGAIFSVDLTGLEGSHQLDVVARDTAGNASDPVSSTYTLDTVAPPAPVLLHTPDHTAWVWRFSIEALTTAECSLDGGPWATCTSPVPGGVPDQTVRFEVRAVDRAGNRSGITRTTVTPTQSTGAQPPAGPASTPDAPTHDPSPAETSDTVTPIGGGVLAGDRAPTRPATLTTGTADANAKANGDWLVRRLRPEEKLFGGPVAQLLQAVGEKTTIPVLVVLIVLGFVGVQNRIDRRDPKLAQAPLRHEPEYLEFR